jgi:S1-C subfamily serine protease
MRRPLLFVIALFTGLGVLGGVMLSGPGAPPTAAPTVEQTPAPMPAVRSIDELPDFTVVAERAVEASVNISSTRLVRVDPWTQFWYGSAVRPSTSAGSGVVVSPDGYILTNSHVIGNAGAEIQVTLADNRDLPATLVGLDEFSDVAVVKVDATGLPTLPWGDSSRLRVAEWVLAIGSPFSIGQTVTLGIVSAVNRRGPNTASYSDFIQTDAAVNPGNSGGALINGRGELVGINTMIYGNTGGYQGISFAVPSNVAREIMDELIANGEVIRGSIGNLTFVDAARCARVANLDDNRGACIYEMYRSDPAFEVGLRPLDVIVGFNGSPVGDSVDLRRLIADAEIGSTARVEIVREGRRMTANVPVIRRRPPERRY